MKAMLRLRWNEVPQMIEYDSIEYDIQDNGDLSVTAKNKDNGNFEVYVDVVGLKVTEK